MIAKEPDFILLTKMGTSLDAKSPMHHRHLKTRRSGRIAGDPEHMRMEDVPPYPEERTPIEFGFHTAPHVVHGRALRMEKLPLREGKLVSVQRKKLVFLLVAFGKFGVKTHQSIRRG